MNTNTKRKIAFESMLVPLDTALRLRHYIKLNHNYDCEYDNKIKIEIMLYLNYTRIYVVGYFASYFFAHNSSSSSSLPPPHDSDNEEEIHWTQHICNLFNV